MKKSNDKMKTMDINEASKIVSKAQKEGGENWYDYWAPMEEDLLFISACLQLVEGYLEAQDNPSVTRVIDDLEERTGRVRKNLDEVRKKLRQKHRLGPIMPTYDDDFVFTLPKVTIEKYKLT